MSAGIRRRRGAGSLASASNRIPSICWCRGAAGIASASNVLPGVCWCRDAAGIASASYVLPGVCWCRDTAGIASASNSLPSVSWLIHRAATNVADAKCHFRLAFRAPLWHRGCWGCLPSIARCNWPMRFAAMLLAKRVFTRFAVAAFCMGTCVRGTKAFVNNSPLPAVAFLGTIIALWHGV